MAEFALPTGRLVLRNWRQADVAPFHAMCQDPQVMAYLGPPITLERAQEIVDHQRFFQAGHGHCFWAMERLSDGAMLGFCGLKPGPADTPLEGRVEIGWRLRADAWGQGYAREAAQACLDWGFANLPDDRIWAITVPANIRSWGLMERLGMTRHEDLGFDHPALPADSPLLRHITYSIGR